MAASTLDQNQPALSCSVGIMAYNEAANIASAIESIITCPLDGAVIAEVIVVASGCTDGTVAIVNELAQRDERIRLIEQERREGKAAAINLFLGAATSEILIMASADVVIKAGALDALLRPLRDPGVGMVGAHPIPVNDEMTFMGHAVHLLWRLHDRIARETPKLGEVVAFRNVVPSIPTDTPVDEISIQALITQWNYRLVYEPQAVVFNRGPQTVRDFLRQRRRIYNGHLKIRQQQQYAASTMSVGRIGQALWAERPFATPRMALWTLGAIGLEGCARMLGAYDHLRKRPQHLWQMAMTTKAGIADNTGSQAHETFVMFRLADYHQHELELGAHRAALLVQQVIQRMRHAWGTSAAVDAGRNGTIIVLLAVDGDGAQQQANQLIQSIGDQPIQINGRRDGVTVRLEHGIFAFERSGNAGASSGLTSTLTMRRDASGTRAGARLADEGARS